MVPGVGADVRAPAAEEVRLSRTDTGGAVALDAADEPADTDDEEAG